MSNSARKVARNQLKSRFKNKYIRKAWHEGIEKAEEFEKGDKKLAEKSRRRAKKELEK